MDARERLIGTQIHRSDPKNPILYIYTDTQYVISLGVGGLWRCFIRPPKPFLLQMEYIGSTPQHG